MVIVGKFMIGGLIMVLLKFDKGVPSAEFVKRGDVHASMIRSYFKWYQDSVRNLRGDFHQ